jgi:hypothetical protein
MNKTRWMIALGVLVTLVVLGSKAAVREPAKTSDAVAAPVNLEPVDMPAAIDSSQRFA